MDFAVSVSFLEKLSMDLPGSGCLTAPSPYILTPGFIQLNWLPNLTFRLALYGCKSLDCKTNCDLILARLARLIHRRHL